MDRKTPRPARDIEQLSRYLMQAPTDCELCRVPGGELLWEDDFSRVILVADGDYPGYCRVMLQAHAREMTDLPPPSRSRLMDVVFATEAAIRHLYQPDKINLASFGNMVPHLHWHVIPRWRDDRHFPQSVWSTPQRVGSPVRPAVSNRQLGEEIRCRIGS